MRVRFDKKNIPYRGFFGALKTPLERFFRAVYQKDTDLALMLIESGGVPASTPLNERTDKTDHYTDTGMSLLHAVVQAGDIPSARRLLEFGADPNHKTFFQETPVLYAAKNGDYAMLKLLYSFGGDLHVRPFIRGNYAGDGERPRTPLEEFKEQTGEDITVERLQKDALLEKLAETGHLDQKKPAKPRKI